MNTKRISCPVPGYENCWIDRKNPVSVKLWDEWKSADVEQTREVLSKMIVAWNFPCADDEGRAARQPSEGSNALEDLDLHLLSWLVYAINESLITEFTLDPLVLKPLPIASEQPS